MNSFDKTKLIVDFAAQNKVTTVCCIVWTIVSLITANPTVIDFDFLSASSKATILQVSSFLKDAAVAFGLLFAADSKMPKLSPIEEEKKTPAPEPAPKTPAKKVPAKKVTKKPKPKTKP